MSILMVQKVNMLFSKPTNRANATLIQPIIPNSRPAMSNTLRYCSEMKQMIKRIQGVPSGCSSCGGKKKK
jgi:hypothetical protein